MLGGIASGNWAPIHHFCEEHKNPCIFPVTDQPVVSDSDWYTLYLSKGFYQEGETAARYLRSTLDAGQKNSIVQIYRSGSNGALLAQGFRENLGESGVITTTEKKLGADEPLTDKLLQELFAAQQPAAVQLWFDSTDMTTATNWLVKQSRLPATIFASWKLLDGNASVIPDNLPDKVYLSYPRDLPENTQRLWTESP
ncbi:MAG: hypothetical protein DRQ44_01840 [Gammaproteobacteria bacterium]|nr:MAG: hypothetical protein DRQ44_01840 [Gammaproteobacteria bacterium]